MELGVLILFNILFLIILYAIFSIRLGRAFEKARKSGIPREFYENIELIIQYLDTTLESVTQKNDAFYKLLIRSENLKKELEGLLERYEKTSRRRAKKEPLPAVSEAEPPSGELRAHGIPVHPRGEREPSPLDGALDRLLRQAGEDRVEWTRSDRELPELIGAKADRPPPLDVPASNRAPGLSVSSKPREENGVSRLFGTIGRFTRKLLGSEETSASARTEMAAYARSDAGEARPPRVDGSFENQLYGYTPVGGKSTRLPYPSGEVVERPPQVKTEHGVERAESVERGVASSASGFPEEAYFPDGVPGGARGSSSPPSRPADEGKHADSVHDSVLSDFPEIPDLTRAGDRAAFVRTLLRRGMSGDQIAAATGISFQEIEFIEKVMQNIGTSSDRRRGRRNG